MRKMVLCKVLFNIMLYLFSLLIPKSKKYVIIGGWYGERYADNSRALYEYLEENKSSLGIKKVFWYTKNKGIYEMIVDKGGDALFGINLKSIFWHLRSKVHIIDQGTRDIIGILSVRCIRINLWHGVPLKKIGNYLRPGGASWKKKFRVAGMWDDSYILATSEYIGKLLTIAMGTREEYCLVASYPRNRDLYKINNEYSDNDEFKVFYLPTYRYEKDVNPILNCDLVEWDNRLRENNIVLYIKPHYASLDYWKVSSEFSNIHIMDSSEDVYDMLKCTNLLITDYSSVYFDYMITRRPILFFPYDLDRYENIERGFVMPYEENTPGKKVFEGAEVIDEIIYIKNNYEKYNNIYMERYEEVLKKVNKYSDSEDYSDILKFWK